MQGDGVVLFFADWHVVPGAPWQEALEDALEASRACAVFVGAGPLGPWQNEEMRVALEERARRPEEMRVIPVLLPGTPDPESLLARAALRRVATPEAGKRGRSGAGGARDDLLEAQEIAERGSMRLFECDVHLEWTRLCLASGEGEAARGHLEVARGLIEETGYGRREGEVALLEVSLRGRRGNTGLKP